MKGFSLLIERGLWSYKCAIKNDNFNICMVLCFDHKSGFGNLRNVGNETGSINYDSHGLNMWQMKFYMALLL